MKHLHRVHGVGVSSLHETVGRNGRAVVDIRYCPTDDMKADIYTQPFTSAPRYQHALSLIGIVSNASPALACVPCEVVPLPARRRSGAGDEKDVGDGSRSSCTGDPKVAKVCNDVAVQTDDVDDRCASSSRTRKQRLKKGRIPAMPAMGRPPVWPHDHGLSGYIRPEVVDQPKGDAIRRTYETDTLYDVVTIFVQLKISVMQELGMCEQAESKHKWRELLEMMVCTEDGDMDDAQHDVTQLFILLVTAPTAEQGHTIGSTATVDQRKDVMHDR